MGASQSIPAGFSVLPVPVSFTDLNNAFVQTDEAVYTEVAKFNYPGTSNAGIHTVIEANVYNDGGTDVDIRIVDITNGSAVIAELTGITSSSTDNVEDLGTVSNLPTAPALFAVEILLNGGGMGDDAKVSALTMY